MELELKRLPSPHVRAEGSDLEEGQFEAIVAVIGNVDSYGDRIVKDAFKRTLSNEGRGFPAVVWSHQWGVVPIGACAEAEEVYGFKTADGKTIDGLRIVGDLLIDDHEVARQAHAAMKKKGGDGKPALREFSFAFFTKAARVFDEPDEDGAWRELEELDVIEVGPTLLGANPETQLIDAASMLSRRNVTSAVGKALADAGEALIALKEGRVLSSSNRKKIVAAVEALSEVLEADDKDDKHHGSEADDEITRRARELMLDLPAFPAVSA